MSEAVAYPPLDTSLEAVPHLLVARSIPHDQELFFVGVRHFNDSEDSQYQIVTELYERFIDDHVEQASPRLLSITEGDKHKLIEGETPELTVRRAGEQALHMALASKNGVERITSEPPYLGTASHLVERYGTDLTSYFYFMRHARQYRDIQETGEEIGSFDEYVRDRQTMKVLAAADQLLDFSQERLQETHEKLYPGTPLDPAAPLSDGSMRSAEHYVATFFPFNQASIVSAADMTPMQEIMLHCNLLRDKHLLQLITDHWDRGYSIFDTHGSLHAVTLEPVLQKRLKVETFERYVGTAACNSFLEKEALGHR